MEATDAILMVASPTAIIYLIAIVKPFIKDKRRLPIVALIFGLGLAALIQWLAIREIIIEWLAIWFAAVWEYEAFKFLFPTKEDSLQELLENTHSDYEVNQDS